MLKNFRNGYEVSGKSETAKREKNDCAVRAVANACNVNYEQAHAWVKDAFGRQDGKGTQMFNFIMKQTKQIEFEQAGQLDMFADNNVKKIKYVVRLPIQNTVTSRLHSLLRNLPASSIVVAILFPLTNMHWQLRMV